MAAWGWLPGDGCAGPQAMAIIEKSIGKPIKDVFSAVSSEPVAAASLGQVRDQSEEGQGDIPRAGTNRRRDERIYPGHVRLRARVEPFSQRDLLQPETSKRPFTTGDFDFSLEVQRIAPEVVR
eukprot:7749020-Pyramimonas_sp.AAC.1